MREIALHILDICQNSITANATNIQITLNIDEEKDKLQIIIWDNGCGMGEEFLKKVTNPFTTTRTTRKIGLGIPLFKAGCEACNGSFKITSVKNQGTKVKAEYRLSHIDRPPLGELAETIHTIITVNPEINIDFSCSVGKKVFILKTKVLKETLQGLPLNHNDVSIWLLGFLQDGLKELFGGKNI